MSTKKQGMLERSNNHLQRQSWTNYLIVLKLICADHPNDFVFTTAARLISNRNWNGLLRYADSLSKQSYLTALDHFNANQLAAIIRKYPFPSDLISVDPEKDALKKFWRSEHKCKRSNQRFRAFNKRSPYEPYLSRCRSFIQYVLGASPPPLGEVYSSSGFGPGANIGVGGNDTHLARKLASRWSVTPAAYMYGRSAVLSDDHLFELLAPHNGTSTYSVDQFAVIREYDLKTDIVSHNKIAFVPKTTSIYRSIAVEPLINSYLQKGVDVLMRRKLARVGIDLSRQDHNCEFARLGSLNDTDDGFVTLDLSSASDSLSIELARNLCPPEWFELLNSLRSPEFLLHNEKFVYQKFCSMGNGFCFPLQSLIFASICHASDCGRPGQDFLVYGDDIVVRKRYANTVINLLKICGFEVNQDKSFISGPFRESCGRDWFEGKDVRPFIFDFSLESLSDLFKFLNLSCRNDRTTSFFECTREFIISLIPPRLRFCRPFPGEENTAYEVSLDQFMTSPHAKWNSNLQCWSWRELHIVSVGDNRPTRYERYDVIIMIAALRGVSSSKPFTFRRKTRTRVRRVAHSGALSTWVPSEGRLI